MKHIFNPTNKLLIFAILVTLFYAGVKMKPEIIRICLENMTQSNSAGLANFALNTLFSHLPPDPGEQGKNTIEGIDINANGIRDDVERFIFRLYPQGDAYTDLKRKSLMQYAKAAQEGLLSTHDRNLSIKKSFKVLDSMACGYGVFGPPPVDDPTQDPFIIAFNKLELQILNTKDRISANWKASQNFSGQYHDSYSSRVWQLDRCDFDVSWLFKHLNNL